MRHGDTRRAWEFERIVARIGETARALPRMGLSPTPLTPINQMAVARRTAIYRRPSPR
jgi:hypothetical protein